jgi:O-antigen ligase
MSALLIIVVAVLPLAVLAVVFAARDPLRRLLPLYAAAVPFGDGLAIPGLPASYFSASSIAGLLLILTLGWRLVTTRHSVRRVPATVVVWLLFLAVAGITVFWSVDAAGTSDDYVVIGTLIVLYVAVRLSDVDAAVLRRLEWGILAGGGAAAAYGLYQVYAGTLQGGASDSLRFGRDLTDPNHLAATLLLPLAIALAGSGAARRLPLRACLGLYATTILVAIVLTGSRGGVLGAAVVFLVLALAGVARARTSAMGLAALGIVVILALAVPSLVNDRLADEGSSGRTGIWRVGLSSCSEHCLIGSGWGTFGVVYEAYLPRTPEAGTLRGTRYGAHNNLLRVLVEAGVAGFALVLAGLLLTVREAFVVPRRFRGPPLAAIVGLWITGMLLGNIAFKYFWLVLIYVGVVNHVHAGRSEAFPDGAAPAVDPDRVEVPALR